MSIRAVKFTENSSPVIVELQPELGEDFGEAAGCDTRTIFVVVSDDLESFRELKDVFVDRGKKNDAKTISDYCLGHKPIPLLDATNYTGAGRLNQGIEKFWPKALGEPGTKSYIVGVAENVFTELLREANSDHRSGNSATVHQSLNLLDDLPKVTIPQKLLQTYAGVSHDCMLVRQFIIQWAATDDPVLILGESGTGKEVVAKSIHEYSSRSRYPFIHVNCAAIPEQLFESELFGAEPGAATDITKARAGLWEQANKGTLFLDEIGDLSRDHQAKILTAIEKKEIRRLGANESQKVDVRIIAATNVDLEFIASTGQFRRDLYYRLKNMLPIYTPSLRDHPEDIPAIVQRLWQKLTGNEDAKLSTEVVRELCKHEWSGNVRDLRGELLALQRTYKDVSGIQFGLKELRTAMAIRNPQRDRAPMGINNRLGVTTAQGKSFGQCFDRLQKIAETLRVCGNVTKLIADSDTPANRIKVANSLKYRISELEQLCSDPLLLHRKDTFDQVHRFVGDLRYFQSILPTGNGTSNYYTETVVPNLAMVLEAVSTAAVWLRDHIYEPEPIDTSDVKTPDDLLGLVEELAANNHDVWAKRRMDEGWRYGIERDDIKKTNPDIRPYAELSESEKQYDRDSVAQTVKAIITMGYQIVKN